MRTLLALLIIVVASCIPQPTQAGYSLSEIGLLFPEGSERWTYFYGDPGAVRLGTRTVALTPNSQAHIWAVRDALWADGQPVWREVGAALRPPAGKLVRGFPLGRLVLSVERDIKHAWLYDGQWFRLSACLLYTSTLQVLRWQGGTWTDLGNVLANDAERLGNSSHIDLSVDSKNRVVVAYDYGFGQQTLVIKRQSGSRWKQVGPLITKAKQPSLITLPSTTPILAYVESLSDLSSAKVVVVRLSGGTSWSKISDLPLAFNEHHQPVLRAPSGLTKPFFLSYIDRSSTSGEVQVRRRY